MIVIAISIIVIIFCLYYLALENRKVTPFGWEDDWFYFGKKGKDDENNS